MTTKYAGVALATLFLCSCAESYPDLVTFKPAKPGEELRTILQEAETLQASYSAGYKATAKWQDLSQLPIIGAATVAAFVLLNDHKNAAKTASKIGIGTLSYTAARGQFAAAGLPDIYIAGHGALTCILSEGSNFDGAAATQRHGRLLAQLDEIDDALQKTSELRYFPIDEGDQAENLKVARAVADQAIAAAQAVETLALNQESHYLSAAPTFRNAIANVSVRVASKGRVRQSVDYAALRDQMVPPKAPPKAAAGESTEPHAQGLAEFQADDAKETILKLMMATRNLTVSTARLTAATPDYKKSLDNVTECPKQVG